MKVNGINPDGVVRGSGIFAGGWGAKRAAVYGVPEEELGAYYAQRTLLKREVLPENIANAAFALCTSDFSHTTGLHVPVDAGVAAAFLQVMTVRSGRRHRPGRDQRPGDARRRRAGPAGTANRSPRFANDPVQLWNGAPHRAALGLSRACSRRLCAGLAEAGRRVGQPGRRRCRLRGPSTTGCCVAARCSVCRTTTATPAPTRACVRCTARSTPADLYRPQRPAVPAVHHHLPAGGREGGRATSISRTARLLMPDLIGYWLTGRQVTERTERLDRRACCTPTVAGTTSWPPGWGCARICSPASSNPAANWARCCARCPSPSA